MKRLLLLSALLVSQVSVAANYNCKNQNATLFLKESQNTLSGSLSKSPGTRAEEYVSFKATLMPSAQTHTTPTNLNSSKYSGTDDFGSPVSLSLSVFPNVQIIVYSVIGKETFTNCQVSSVTLPQAPDNIPNCRRCGYGDIQ